MRNPRPLRSTAEAYKQCVMTRDQWDKYCSLLARYRKTMPIAEARMRAEREACER